MDKLSPHICYSNNGGSCKRLQTCGSLLCVGPLCPIFLKSLSKVISCIASIKKPQQSHGTAFVSVSQICFCVLSDWCSQWLEIWFDRCADNIGLSYLGFDLGQLTFCKRGPPEYLAARAVIWSAKILAHPWTLQKNGKKRENTHFQILFIIHTIMSLVKTGQNNPLNLPSGSWFQVIRS